MKSYFYSQSYNDNIPEYTIVSEGIPTIYTPNGSEEDANQTITKPLLIPYFNINEKNESEDGINAYKWIKDAVESAIGFKKESTNILSTYILLTHGFHLFNTLPLLWLHLPQYAIRDTLLDIVRTLSFNGLNLYSGLPFEQIEPIIADNSPTIIMDDFYKSGFKKHRLLLEEGISKNHIYISHSNIEQALFSPRIILCPSLSYQMGHVLPLTIRSIEHFYGVAESMCTKIHLSSIQFFIDHHKSISNSYQELITEKQTNFSYLPILAIAKTLYQLKLLEESELNAIETFLGEVDESIKFHSSPEDDIIYGLSELLSEEGQYDYDDWIPLKGIVNYIKPNSDLGDGFNEQALSRYLNRQGLIKGVPARKRFANNSNNPNDLEKIQRTCIKINKTVLNNKMKELQHETTL
jgi:hypothetical protein